MVHKSKIFPSSEFRSLSRFVVTLNRKSTFYSLFSGRHMLPQRSRVGAVYGNSSQCRRLSIVMLYACSLILHFGFNTHVIKRKDLR